MLTVEALYIRNHWMQHYKSIYFWKAEDLYFPKINICMGLCPVNFWYIAGNVHVQLYATPNLRYWPLGGIYTFVVLHPMVSNVQS